MLKCCLTLDLVGFDGPPGCQVIFMALNHFVLCAHVGGGCTAHEEQNENASVICIKSKVSKVLMDFHRQY